MFFPFRVDMRNGMLIRGILQRKGEGGEKSEWRREVERVKIVAFSCVWCTGCKARNYDGPWVKSIPGVGVQQN